MQINSLQSILQNLRVRSPTSAPDPLAQKAAGPAPAERADLLRARSELLDLFRSLQDIEALTSGTSRLALDLPDARSNPALGLDLATTAARLESAEEINTIPTSFSPFGPDWSGLSTALLTIGGVYDGSNGTGQLSFEVREGGIHGIDRLRIRVYDPFGSVDTNIQVREIDPLDQQYALGNGLYFTLGNGALVFGETATLDVNDVVGSAVDPSLPLGGTRNQNPNLEPSVPAIVDGSFQVNGQAVSIDTTTDSLNDVIDRINASDTGATARFDEATQQVVIEAAAGNDMLELDSNGTGFFAAVNIPEGRVDTEAIAGGISRRRSYQIADSVERMLAELNELFRDQTFAGGISNASLFRGPLDVATRNFFGGEDARLLESFGIAFSRSDIARRNGTYAALDRSAFAHNVQRRGDDVRVLLFGDSRSDGLVQTLATATRRAIGTVNQLLGVAPDSLIDEYA